MTHAANGKQFLQLGDVRLAYHDIGNGPPILLLHGCPFGSFVWRHIIPRLSATYRCIAPDLLGLGDTETPLDADWSLRAQASAMIALVNALRIDRAHVVGHDHGGAVAQLLGAEHPNRVDRLILCDSEAYDNWPSAEERPFVRATQIPVVGDMVLWLWARRAVLRATLLRAKAVHNAAALTGEFVDAMIAANLRTAHRRAKTKRFLAEQFDPRNNRVTIELIDALRRFNRPTLLVWGKDDVHFPPQWAERLRDDIPGTQRLEILPDTGHLVMEERPDAFAALVRSFLEGTGQ